jgi:hypothetical protein
MMTGACEHTTACEFQERLTAAQPGAVIMYATGFLAEDIHQAFLKKDPNATELSQVAGLALKAANGGNAFLTQRRIGPRRFEYRAQKLNGASGASR